MYSMKNKISNSTSFLKYTRNPLNYLAVGGIFAAAYSGITRNKNQQADEIAGSNILNYYPTINKASFHSELQPYPYGMIARLQNRH